MDSGTGSCVLNEQKGRLDLLPAGCNRQMGFLHKQQKTSRAVRLAHTEESAKGRSLDNETLLAGDDNSLCASSTPQLQSHMGNKITSRWRANIRFLLISRYQNHTPMTF
ncbi:hypothetical protein F2P79_001050 [Pimephales promelas]|nr:hypothetical protein F2P79_001050 [Pimephales promelas]